MADIDFHKIAARSGSQSNAFEELCCQLAKRSRPTDEPFERFRGAGGDGGVECISQLNDGSMIGWQAKFVFDVSALIAQAKISLRTALSIHDDLTKYIVCFPFDSTGKTGRTARQGRPAKSGSENLNTWIAKEIQSANNAGRDLTIDLWPASEIQSLLFEHDPSGGIREYFFKETILSRDWFNNHITAATKAAGPRYTPELNVGTDLWHWFSAFEGDETWRENFDTILHRCRQANENLQRQVEATRHDQMNPSWPPNELQLGQDMIKACEEILLQAQALRILPTENGLEQISAALGRIHSALSELELRLASDLDTKHGQGSANSKRFRTYMAEYMVSFPAANLDIVRDVAKEFDELGGWLRSPAGYLAFKRVFILSGVGGSGKTHGICDMATKRLERGAYTGVLFGHQFSGEPAAWTRLTESLGLPASLGKDCLLDALNAAGEGSGTPLMFCIDAVNETRPRNYWLHRFLPLAHEFEQRPFLKLCVSCRTSFLPACLPQANSYRVVEHRGFEGIERQACNAFFLHYDLEPPLVPVLQPELSNPLYLKLVCETLKLKHLKRLPSGWFGLKPVINAFLSEKERQFAAEHGISEGAAIVSGSLLAIANAIAKTGNVALPWSEAQRVINERRPQAGALPVLEWLVKGDLLIEDGPIAAEPLGRENVLRPAFERFGDFLIAAELLPKVAPEHISAAISSDGNILQLLANLSSVQTNAGVIQALSILLPETAGVELADLIKDTSVREATLALTMRALPWRTPDSFSYRTGGLAREALANEGWETMDSLLAVSAHPSKLDAYWTSTLLASLPMATRDSVWCGYLHKRYEENGIVKRLIEAVADMDLKRVDSGTAARWSIILLWFTAAADRRVKDHATRAAVAIFRAHSTVILPLLEKLLNVDDDEIRERILLCAYGALIATRDKKALKPLAEFLLTKYAAAPTLFQNAILRDHMRCIGELARQLKCLHKSFDPSITSKRRPGSDRPLTVPDQVQVDNWKKSNGAVRLVARSSLDDDFNHYSINCLSPWMHQMNKSAIGGWILRHVVEEFGIEGDILDGYDGYMVSMGGGGRGKPTWAERIGKKYQWIALYRLASRLHDNMDREESSWEPKPMRLPLILVKGRKLDPTLSRTIIPERKASECWWLPAGVDLAATKDLDFASWVSKQDDLPSLETLLQVTEHARQRWIILNASPRWSEYQPDKDPGTSYRDTWMHLRGYLVPRSQFTKATKALDGRNYFGGWLPEAGMYLYGFAGEYPWATAYNTVPDWNRGSIRLIHSSNEVAIEWEYDATLPSSIYLQVPTTNFFSQNDLWWNGTDGFATGGGKTVFFDPRIQYGGSPALLAERRRSPSEAR